MVLAYKTGKMVRIIS